MRYDEKHKLGSIYGAASTPTPARADAAEATVKQGLNVQEIGRTKLDGLDAIKISYLDGSGLKHLAYMVNDAKGSVPRLSRLSAMRIVGGCRQPSPL